MYVPLDVNFPDDPKIMQVGIAGAGLYAQSLCIAKRLWKDGVVTRWHLRRLGDQFEVDELIVECVKAGLFAQLDEDTFQIVAWLSRNMPADAMHADADAMRTAQNAPGILASSGHNHASKGAWAAHVKWHLNRGVSKPGCQFCEMPKPQVDATFVHTDAMHTSIDPDARKQNAFNNEEDKDNDPDLHRLRKHRGLGPAVLNNDDEKSDRSNHVEPGAAEKARILAEIVRPARAGNRADRGVYDLDVKPETETA